MAPSNTLTILAVADTQVVVWYLNDRNFLSSDAYAHIKRIASVGIARIGVSAITIIELIYLIEKSKLPDSSLPLLVKHLRDDAGLFTLVDIDSKVANTVASISRDEVADMPDRIIAATALSLGVPLITADGKILKSKVPTIW